MKYLDKDGLQKVADKIKSKYYTKQQIEDLYLPRNDFNQKFNDTLNNNGYTPYKLLYNINNHYYAIDSKIGDEETDLSQLFQGAYIPYDYDNKSTKSCKIKYIENDLSEGDHSLAILVGYKDSNYTENNADIYEYSYSNGSITLYKNDTDVTSQISSNEYTISNPNNQDYYGIFVKYISDDILLFTNYPVGKDMNEVYWSKSLDSDEQYPVGSIYMSTDPIYPDQLFGGTWEAVSNGIFASSEGDHADKIYIWRRTSMLPKVIGRYPYPIGAVYMSSDDTDPSTLFGGTWTKINSGIFANGDYNINIWNRTA